MFNDKKWIGGLARAGYATRGAVYLVIAFFAVLAALGSGSKTGTHGALHALLQQPFGAALLVTVIIGLAGYAFWRFLQAVLDADDHGWTARGLVIRAALLVSALTYLGLALYALSLLGVPSSTGSGGSKSTFLSSAVNTIGPLFVTVALSIVFAGIAFAHFRKAWMRKYQRHIDAPSRHGDWIDIVAIIGLVARGLIFAVIALLLALRIPGAGDDDVSIPDLQTALDYVHGLPAGWVLLALLGAGLALFAAYSFVEARWRKVGV